MKKKWIEFISSRKRSFHYAFSGVQYVLRTQKNSWIHLFIMISVTLVGIVLHLEAFEWACLVLCFTMVWVSEFFNSSIETIVDLVSPEDHPLAKISKDVGAAAVLIAAAGSIIVGLIILGPPLIRLFIDLMVKDILSDYVPLHKLLLLPGC